MKRVPKRVPKPEVVRGDAQVSVELRFGCVHIQTRNEWVSHMLSICKEKDLLLWGQNYLVKGAGLYFNLAEDAGVLMGW